MQLPHIAPGKRFTLPRPTGSADALLLARHAQARVAEGQVLGIVTAEPGDAQRLAEEMAFFAPGCGWRCSRTGRPCPTTPSARTRT
jgi:transcription-repair coupling factor (superfamily II helicase)